MSSVADLTIFWAGEEVPGVTCYALVAPEDEELSHYVLKLSPGGAEVKSSTLSGPGWKVFLWDIKIERWPLQVRQWIFEMLSTLVSNGAKIAWLGFDGFFADPPYLFDLSRMSGGVYAAYSKRCGFRYNGNETEFQSLTDSELLALKAEVEQLLG